MDVGGWQWCSGYLVTAAFSASSGERFQKKRKKKNPKNGLCRHGLRVEHLLTTTESRTVLLFLAFALITRSYVILLFQPCCRGAGSKRPPWNGSSFVRLNRKKRPTFFLAKPTTQVLMASFTEFMTVKRWYSNYLWFIHLFCTDILLGLMLSLWGATASREEEKKAPTPVLCRSMSLSCLLSTWLTFAQDL